MFAGLIFENMARQRQQREERHAFLSGGEGAAYYQWKVGSWLRLWLWLLALHGPALLCIVLLY